MIYFNISISAIARQKERKKSELQSHIVSETNVGKVFLHTVDSMVSSEIQNANIDEYIF